MEKAITIKNVHLKYREVKKLSIKDILINRSEKVFNEFEALKGVSFELEKGKILGITGKNGSGKSTLLRAIAGIFSPNEGTINVHNNKVSLLSIDVGFQPKLTGYENIYLSGMLLGFSHKEIEQKEKEIIEFSEIGDFIYKPVRTYSSGMYSKLAFSITAILETDIMLIDEILSVGDTNFRKKSYNKIKELINDDNHTVVIVSHDMNTLKDLCDEVIWLHDGKIKMKGKTHEVLPLYEEFMK